jgi:hypothetical protein
MRKRPKYVIVDETKEIVDVDGKRHLVRKIIGSDNEGNLIVEDVLGRIITIKLKKPIQTQSKAQIFPEPIPA